MENRCAKLNHNRREVASVAHEIVVIDPNNGDEKIAHCVAEPCGPVRQKRLEGWNLRWRQFQNQHSNKYSEHAVGERAQSLRGRPMEHSFTVPCALPRPASRCPRKKSRTSNAFETFPPKLAWMTDQWVRRHGRFGSSKFLNSFIRQMTRLFHRVRSTFGRHRRITAVGQLRSPGRHTRPTLSRRFRCSGSQRVPLLTVMNGNGGADAVINGGPKTV
jgi:hypothetical protein